MTTVLPRKHLQHQGAQQQAFTFDGKLVFLVGLSQVLSLKEESHRD
jgi:hypothetical protein